MLSAEHTRLPVLRLIFPLNRVACKRSCIIEYNIDVNKNVHTQQLILVTNIVLI